MAANLIQENSPHEDSIWTIPGNRSDEVGLIHSALQGNLDSFNQLVLAYQDLVYNQAFNLLRDKESAEDATQDAFLIAYRKLNSFRGPNFRSWLLRIVTNLCLDQLRQWKRRQTIALYPLDSENEEIESPSWLVDPGFSPERAVEQIELQRLIEQSLAELPAEYRATVYLVDVLQFDYLEAADALGIPMGTVKSRLARARQQLRNKLNHIVQ
jgi:RNA polymerase sigma-70 factor, ECF subfamily